MKMYVSVDPGQTVGLATWGEDGKLIHKSKMPRVDFERFLWGTVDPTYPNEILKFIVEKYVVYGNMTTAHIGRDNPTEQVIGMIDMIARKLGVPVIKQPATILKITAKWAGIKIPGGHCPDDISAYLHGYHYLHKRGIIPARVLEGN